MRYLMGEFPSQICASIRCLPELTGKEERDMTPTEALYHVQRLLRLAAVEQFSGLKRTAIWEHMARGEFPRPIKLTDSGRAIAWDEAELIAWRDARKAARDKAA
jgi:prophage regulatory protein